MQQRYEAHVFAYWLHRRFKDVNTEQPAQPAPRIVSQFEHACERYHITPKQGHDIVAYYLKRYTVRHKTVFDMGRQPDIALLDLHFYYKREGPFRERVLDEMVNLHNDHLYRSLYAKRRRPNISDLLTRRRP